jgi:hypothetical protein
MQLQPLHEVRVPAAAGAVRVDRVRRGVHGGVCRRGRRRGRRGRGRRRRRRQRRGRVVQRRLRLRRRRRFHCCVRCCCCFRCGGGGGGGLLGRDEHATRDLRRRVRRRRRADGGLNEIMMYRTRTMMLNEFTMQTIKKGGEGGGEEMMGWKHRRQWKCERTCGWRNGKWAWMPTDYSREHPSGLSDTKGTTYHQKEHTYHQNKM